MLLLTNQFLQGPRGTQIVSASNQLATILIERIVQGYRPVPDQLMFRIYGLTIGCQLTSDSQLMSAGRALTKSCVIPEMDANNHNTETSAINKVMLACSLNPIALQKRPDEDFITV